MSECVVVAGCGEIGLPIYQLCLGGYDQVIAEDPRRAPPCRPRFPVAALHVAIPGRVTGFAEAVLSYARKYDPGITLVHSSSEPGCMDQIIRALGEDNVVHTPVHGKHQGGRMKSDMLMHPKFVGTRSDAAFEKAKAALCAIGHPPASIVRLSSPLASELVKLLATTYFGYLIVWAQEIERLARKSGVPYEQLMSFTRIETSDFSIRGKYPGVIGGHCVMPNIEILNRFYPSPLWEQMKRSNELKAKEAGNAADDTIR